MEKVSVVIPIYNVEDYIDDCLKSVVNQTYKNLEIICVDDCGTDNSINIVEDYVKSDHRIKIIRQKRNKGQGEARNLGIADSATGKYICFIDSDDFIESNYIESLVKTIEDKNVDLVCNINILKYYGSNDIRNKFIKNKKDFVLDKKLNFNEELFKKLPISAWCKIYRTSLIKENKVYFASNKLKFEDFYFWYILKTKVKSICTICGPTYFYRQRNNSTMSLNKYKKNDCFDSIYIIKLIYLYYKNNCLLDTYSIPFNWLDKHFKKIREKNKFFLKTKSLFKRIKEDILKNEKVYKKKDLLFFKCVLNSKNYLMFRIKYFVYTCYATIIKLTCVYSIQQLTKLFILSFNLENTFLSFFVSVFSTFVGINEFLVSGSL